MVAKLVKPLLKIYGTTEHYCKYPTELRVTMEDGTVQTYVLENKTTYQFENVMRCVNRVKVGYQYGEPQKKSRTHRCKL
jgi:hypothetical protein